MSVFSKPKALVAFTMLLILSFFQFSKPILLLAEMPKCEVFSYYFLVNQDQCDALYAFRDASNLEEFSWHDAGVYTLECEWRGVHCGFDYDDYEAHILEIDLGNIGYSIMGTVDYWIGEFIEMTVFNIGNNNFTGTIPNEIGEMHNLETFIISLNNFEGALPQEITDLTKLRVLDVSYNPLEGEIPEDIGELSELRILRLNNTDFAGELPESLSAISTLTELDFSNTELCVPAYSPLFSWLDSIPTVRMSSPVVCGATNQLFLPQIVHD